MTSTYLCYIELLIITRVKGIKVVQKKKSLFCSFDESKKYIDK